MSLVQMKKYKVNLNYTGSPIHNRKRNFTLKIHTRKAIISEKLLCTHFIIKG
jgi:hypothetical protein